MAYSLWQIGSLLLLQGRLEEGRRYLRRAVVCRPWNLHYALSLALALAGSGVYLNGLFKPLHRLKRHLRSKPIGVGA